MGRDNNNAGIHLVPRNYMGKTDVIDDMDHYASILVERRGTVQMPDPFEYNPAIRKIKEENKVVVWNVKGQEKHCVCGNTLDHSDKILLRDQDGGTTLKMSGKVCKKCGMQYVVRGILLDELKKRG